MRLRRRANCNGLIYHLEQTRAATPSPLARAFASATSQWLRQPPAVHIAQVGAEVQCVQGAVGGAHLCSFVAACRERAFATSLWSAVDDLESPPFRSWLEPDRGLREAHPSAGGTCNAHTRQPTSRRRYCVNPRRSVLIALCVDPGLRPGRAGDQHCAGWPRCAVVRPSLGVRSQRWKRSRRDYRSASTRSLATSNEDSPTARLRIASTFPRTLSTSTSSRYLGSYEFEIASRLWCVPGTSLAEP